MKKDKLYFAKYILVEGEIKEGDIGIDAIGKIYKASSNEKDFLSHINSICRKAKLFLCNRDTYYGEPPIGRYIDSEVNGHSITTTKIIGEILTPNIKESQEFSEEDVKSLFIGEKIS